MEQTVDHAEIREWAKARGVVPRRHGQDLSFTDGVQISWREWFEQFDASGLRLSYDATNTAPRSLVYRLA